MKEDKLHLIELYKATLEELRHHDRQNTQAWIGIGIIIAALVAAMSLMFGPNSPIIEEHAQGVRIGFFLTPMAVLFFFAFTTYRFHLRIDKCISVCSKIEDELLERNPPEPTGSKSEFTGLFIRRELQGIGFEKWLKGKLYPFYGVMVILFFITFYLFLFKCTG